MTLIAQFKKVINITKSALIYKLLRFKLCILLEDTLGFTGQVVL